MHARSIMYIFLDNIICHADIPAQVLGKVNNVIKVAKEGETTLFKASQLLEFTSEAFRYAREASQNKSDLQRVSVESLKKYDETFTKMIESRINARMDEAGDQQEECFEFLGECSLSS